jgi:hypothetical protein
MKRPGQAGAGPWPAAGKVTCTLNRHTTESTWSRGVSELRPWPRPSGTGICRVWSAMGRGGNTGIWSAPISVNRCTTSGSSSASRASRSSTRPRRGARPLRRFLPAPGHCWRSAGAPGAKTAGSASGRRGPAAGAHRRATGGLNFPGGTRVRRGRGRRGRAGRL